MLRHRSLRTRLILGIGVITLMMAVAVVGAAYLVERHNSVDAKVSLELRPRTNLVEELRHNITLLAAAYRGFRISQESRFVEEAEVASKNIRETLARYRQSAALISTADEDWIRLETLADSYVRGTSEVMARQRSGQAAEYPEDLMNLRVELYAVADRIVHRNREAIAAAEREAARLAESILIYSLLALLATVAGSSVFAWGITRSVERNTRLLQEATEAVDRGDYPVAFARSEQWARTMSGDDSIGDELVQVGARFHKMVRTLHSRERWAAAHGELVSTLSSHIDLGRLASTALDVLARRVGCHLGAIHVVDREMKKLRPAGTYALGGADVESVDLQEGVLGQVYSSNEGVVIRDVPEDTRFVVKPGFGQVIPRTVVAVPLAVGEEVFGTLALASLHSLSEEQIDFVLESRGQVAVAIKNALAHREVGWLAEQLRARNEQLEAQNSELQAQAEEITAQNEEIRAQAEEITAQNEELESQRNELMERNEELGRMRAREEAERRNLEIIMGSLPEGVIICDAEGSIIATNRVAEKLFPRPVPYGAPAGTYIRELRLCRPDGEPYPSEEFPLVRAAREGTVSSGVQVLVRRHDGQQKILLCNAAPLRDASGAPSGAVGVFQEISEQN